jgi:prepilin-type N-terminal cleavage/methylation domain-containing protein
MRGFLKRAIGRISSQEAGFTLIELLVVIGIIAALTGITIFAVTQFAGKGDDAALESETEVVQSAVNAMMADKHITAVTANDNSNTKNGVNTWTSLPAGTDAAALTTYLKKSTTKYFYCWDASGNVYAQNSTDGVKAVPADAKVSAACKAAP